MNIGTSDNVIYESPLLLTSGIGQHKYRAIILSIQESAGVLVKRIKIEKCLLDHDGPWKYVENHTGEYKNILEFMIFDLLESKENAQR